MLNLTLSWPFRTQIYGLGKEVVDLAFRGSVSRIGGMSLADLQCEAEAFWVKARPLAPGPRRALPACRRRGRVLNRRELWCTVSDCPGCCIKGVRSTDVDDCRRRVRGYPWVRARAG